MPNSLLSLSTLLVEQCFIDDFLLLLKINQVQVWYDRSLHLDDIPTSLTRHHVLFDHFPSICCVFGVLFAF